MSSYCQLLYHIVFRTKYGSMILSQDAVPRLYSYIAGIIKKKDSHLYQVNGIENHIHLLTGLNPSVAIADFMRDIKGSSSIWMRESGIFPLFEGWAEGYGCFTCSYMDLGRLMDYVKNQQTHHNKKSFEDEYRILIIEAGLSIDDRYFL